MKYFFFYPFFNLSAISFFTSTTFCISDFKIGCKNNKIKFKISSTSFSFIFRVQLINKWSFFCLRALYLNLLGLWIILFCAVISGLMMYAFYSHCDPWSSGLVSAPDQVMISIHLFEINLKNIIT